MPEAYEKIKESLMKEGKSEEEAASSAAAIYNAKHKKDPVTNKKHGEEANAVGVGRGDSKFLIQDEENGNNRTLQQYNSYTKI